MLRVDNNAEIVRLPLGLTTLLKGRYALATGSQVFEPRWHKGEIKHLAGCQLDEPVCMAETGQRAYWWFHDHFYWEDEQLTAQDVKALVLEREWRKRRKLDKAHALMNAESHATFARQSISKQVKALVWEQSQGRCAECGSTELLEFDHIIPVAMGGSSTANNLQLLCADCNRAKGENL
jgi:5-methylcytosine-specific restriction endonuclease McrA